MTTKPAAVVEDKAVTNKEMRRKNSIDDGIKRTVLVVDAEQEVRTCMILSAEE